MKTADMGLPIEYQQKWIRYNQCMIWMAMILIINAA